MKLRNLKALMLTLFMGGILIGCEEIPTSGTKQDTANTINVASNLQENQPTPTDIKYSLERYNLIRRAYWLNGEKDKAINLPCEIEKQVGYVVLFTENGQTPVATFAVDGKVSSLNSFLTPDSEYYEQEYGSNGYSVGNGNRWLADVDGTYGENNNGIFFFTPDGQYFEWTGIHLYSDVPFNIENTILKVSE